MPIKHENNTAVTRLVILLESGGPVQKLLVQSDFIKNLRLGGGALNANRLNGYEEARAKISPFDGLYPPIIYQHDIIAYRGMSNEKFEKFKKKKL
jgi:hypothetical protein